MDDELSILETTSAMLKFLGYSTVTVNCGEKALSAIIEKSKSGQAFKAIILDLTIPGGMGGKETIHEIRKFDVITPVFVSSGYAEDPIISNPKQFGFTDSLSKPFTKDELGLLLNKYLKHF
jgi:CheY-like chemotaxis protein